MSARARATRWRWPPLSWEGLRDSNPAKSHHLQDLGHSRDSLATGHAAHPEAVADVVANRHVREECVVLEDGVDVPFEGGRLRDVATVEPDAAAGGPLEAGDKPQRRGLPDPDGPSSEKNSPSAMSREMPSMARCSPNRFVSDVTETAGTLPPGALLRSLLPAWCS